MSVSPKQSLWAITTYFNPSKFKTKKQNFDLFRRRLKAQGVPLLVIESARTPADFELGEQDGEVMLRVLTPDTLWQKERLFNLAIKSLPDACGYVVFMDADILFASDHWPQKLIRALQSHPVVQPFAKSIRMERGQTDVDTLRYRLSNMNDRRRRSFAYHYSLPARDYCVDGQPDVNPGFAWAMRRDVADAFGWYDACILGGGDRYFAYAATNQISQIDTSWNSEAGVAHYRQWAIPFAQAVQGRVGWIPETVFHLWHGDPAGRKYLDRHKILIRNAFDPSRDLRINAAGAWEWTPTGAKRLSRDVKAYFTGRFEDGTPLTLRLQNAMQNVRSKLMARLQSLQP